VRPEHCFGLANRAKVIIYLKLSTIITFSLSDGFQAVMRIDFPSGETVIPKYGSRLIAAISLSSFVTKRWKRTDARPLEGGVGM
jgi:hypothetical protein